MKTRINIELWVEHDDDGIHCGGCIYRGLPWVGKMECHIFKEVLKWGVIKGKTTNRYARCQACIDATGGQHDPSL